jgi:prepilin-type N-terminal cleavage/methylation domain-containing protein
MKAIRHSKKGFTLIEIAIVLGVFSIIMAGVWMVVTVVSENTRSYEASRQLQAAVQGIRQIEQRITGYTSSAGTEITTRLDTQNAFPPEMRMDQTNGNGNLNNPWTSAGNAVHVYVREATVFGVTFTNLPKKACMTLATKMSGSELSGLQAMVFNGGSAINASNLPRTLIDAAGDCSQSGNTNSIEWRFNLRGGN